VYEQAAAVLGPGVRIVFGHVGFSVGDLCSLAFLFSAVLSLLLPD